MSINLNDSIKFNDFVGVETLTHEYKEFTFNNDGIILNIKLAEYYCHSNKFDFNNRVIDNLKKYFSYYLPKYISGFLNSKLNGNFYIGIDDYGFVKGIPYFGCVPYNYLTDEMYRLINKFTKYSLDNFDFNKIIEINFIKIKFEKSDKPLINNKFIKYLEEKKNMKKCIINLLKNIINGK